MQNQSFPSNAQQPGQYSSLPSGGQSNRLFNRTETQMRHYFYKPTNTYKWLILWGCALFLLGIVSFNLLRIIALLCLFLGMGLLIWALILFEMYNDQPSDNEYAGWVAERSQALYEKALQRLHIADESECEAIIEVQGGISSLLQLTKKFPEKEIVVKRLSDGRRHYSINVSMYMFLLKDEIAIYSGYINALSQSERFEDADHYYYKDIVAVSTSGPIYTTWSGERQMQGFFVRATNGDVVGTDYATNIVLREGEDKTEIKGVDQIVARLLYLLRSHKVSSIEANKTSMDLI